MHYGFSLLDILPQSAAGSSPQSTERFAIDYTFWLNLAFLVITGVLAWMRFGSGKKQKNSTSNITTIKNTTVAMAIANIMADISSK